MKYLLILLALFISANAYSDPRMERDVCHFPYNNIDADNEVYRYHSCDYDLVQKVVNGVNVVSGSSHYRKCYDITQGTFPAAAFSFLKGTDANQVTYPDGDGYSGYAVLGTACALVTQNFNAGTGTFSYDEYTTNDWNIEIELGDYDFNTRKLCMDFTEHCRNARQ